MARLDCASYRRPTRHESQSFLRQALLGPSTLGISNRKQSAPRAECHPTVALETCPVP